MGRKLDWNREYATSMVLDGPTTHIQDDVVFDNMGNELMPLAAHAEQPAQEKRKVLPKAPLSDAEAAASAEIAKQLGLS